MSEVFQNLLISGGAIVAFFVVVIIVQRISHRRAGNKPNRKSKLP